MSTLSKFLGRYAGELRQVANVFGSLVAGVALQPQEATSAREAIGNLFKAADNIEKSLKTLKETAPDKTAVKDAVREVLPDLLAGLSEKALRAALEKKTTQP